jgi:CHAT domain-containing protein
VDDAATALLMDRFYQNLLGKRDGLTKPLPKAEALAEAKQWLRNLTQDQATQRLAGLTDGVARAKDQAEAKQWLRNLTQDQAAERLAGLSDGVARGKNQKALRVSNPEIDPKADPKQVKPFEHPRYWAAFILIGDPN